MAMSYDFARLSDDSVKALVEGPRDCGQTVFRGIPRAVFREVFRRYSADTILHYETA